MRISFVYTFNNGGEKLAHAVKPNISLDDQLTYYLTHPIESKQGQMIGTFQIGLSLKKLENRMYELRRDILLVTLGVFCMGMLVTLILARVLLRPIEKLAAATESVTKGELGHLVDIRSRDEIGDLAKGFNQMILQLKESRDNLERNVEDRTRQLAANIKELSQARMSTLRMLEDLEAAKEGTGDGQSWNGVHQGDIK
jgi:methyl-accepting chemotaxis protein